MVLGLNSTKLKLRYLVPPTKALSVDGFVLESQRKLRNLEVIFVLHLSLTHRALFKSFFFFHLRNIARLMLNFSVTEKLINLLDDRDFSSYTPILWKSLPLELREAQTFGIFKAQLKTLF